MSEELGTEFFEGDLIFNGIDGETGEYLLPPMPSETLARLIQGKASKKERAEFFGDQRPEEMTEDEKQQEVADEAVAHQELGFKTEMGPQYPVIPGVDPARLDQAGWALVFPASMDAQHREAIKGALKPLLDLRREQAGEELFRIFEGGAGYRSGERKDQFFKRQTPEIFEGPANPTQMPFYVLLVGSPEEIPFEFQFQLDVMRAVGRIDFGEDYQAYARYAESLVLAESGKIKLPRHASFFGVQTPGDKATQLSADWLVNPLVENLKQTKIGNDVPLKHPWQVDAFVGEGQATKEQLGRLLGGEHTPALLFTASHGMAFKLGQSHQLAHQGALLCQDWAGPGRGIKRDDYFAGEDLASDAQVQGMIALFFACYGAGTPKLDHFAKQAFKARSEIAPNSFVGALPSRLLSQGALAVMGHVERAWGYSFVSPGGNLDNQAFVTTLRQLFNGDPVGLATDQSFNMRYAGLATQFSEVLKELSWDPTYVTDYELARLWTSNNDARNYVVIGDPAARLPVTDVAPEDAERPQIEVSYRPPERKVVEDHPREYSAEPAEAEAAERTQFVAAPAPAGTQTYSVTATVTLLPSGTAAGAPPAFAATVTPTAPGAEAFAIWDKVEGSEVRDKLVDAVKGFVERMGQAVEKAVADITTLEVLTYTSDDMTAVKKDDMEGTAALRAITRIKATGDIELCVPTKGGQVDEGLWTLHTNMVEQAQANRAELMRTAVETVSGLLKVV
ncbi:MAG TPA: hypothetical protein VLY63_05275 [Anaerolineae bacterium]|nr:hypothetical protein [Anaerolineae bacterium]